MSITLSPSKAAYLTRVAEGLSDLAAEDREEVIQDLEAHLAELPDDSVEDTLGKPEAFVAEFRVSAGLDEPHRTGRLDSLRRRIGRLEIRAQRLGQVLNWTTIRPLWVWTRGWLVVSVFAGLTQETPFLRFPIPSIEFQSAVGAVLVAGATWLSVWLDKNHRHPLRDIGTVLYSSTAVLALLIGILSPISLTKPQHFDESITYPQQLTASDGTPIENIYAYDLEGSPVEVLLFDQEGRPLLSLPTYVYDDAEANPTVESLDYGYGTVTFRRDQFGRVIPNLYPLALSTYDDSGRLVPMPPPSLGFPSVEEETSGNTEAVPTTVLTER